MVSAAVQVRAAPDPARFLDAQRAFYAGDPHYVPPFTRFESWQVDPRRNPFFAHAESAFLLAWRDGRCAGRISATRDRLHDEFHGDRVGFFGHFEARDAAVAAALLEAAAGWLAARGATELRGPVDCSTNYKCGLLIGGEPGPPVLAMPHNPPHYAAWLEGFGLRKAKDLLAFFVDAGTIRRERTQRVLARVRERTGVRVRAFRRRELAAEVDVLWRLYHAIWETNWGFAPMSEAEFKKQAREFAAHLDPDLLPIAEIDGEAVGFALALPDLNVAIRAAGGRLLPLGWLRFLRARRRIRNVRVLALGLEPRWRKSGLDALLVDEIVSRSLAAGYHGCEASWVLEDNVGMVRPLETMGARAYRRYRIYSKPLAAAAP
jgi:GNAT superfamily N-acetyltransferase